LRFSKKKTVTQRRFSTTLHYTYFFLTHHIATLRFNYNNYTTHSNTLRVSLSTYFVHL